MTVSESLLQIAELTKQNLQILQVLNDSFYTKSNHLSTVVGETTYTIPSYIALENKVNHVQDAFNNLVHAAKSGEAWFNFDGNSKEIRVRGYQAAPSPIDLKQKSKFEAEAKQLFKDMLTPQPYLNFDVSALPDDINQVIVKKIIPYHPTLREKFGALAQATPSVEMAYPELLKNMGSADRDYVAGDDYLEYDSVYDLPVRHCTRSGNYIIEEVLTDQITENLENIISVRISDKTPLVRIGFDGLSETDVKSGDYLITFDGTAKLKILNVDTTTRILELLIVSGEYVNPIPAGKDITAPKGGTIFDAVSDYSILKLYSSSETNRELHIPLEEDEFVYITVAPINPRLNTQSAWGTGVLVNTNYLNMDTVDGPVGFREYYNNNVSNIGDAMVELATITYPSITKYSSTEWQYLMEAASESLIKVDVVQINKHLNDSDAVKNIRALYSQKKQYQTDLAETQARIASLTSSLAEISFDDMSGIRSAYSAQIAELKDQQNNLITSINKIVDNIALAANNSEIPIEGAKFRARGYFDINEYIKKVASALKVDADVVGDNVIGIEVRYRYRNAEIPQANVSVKDDFLFTDWSLYQPPLRERKMKYEDGRYKLEIDQILYGDNKPKFNQVDIPITQGENVEMQVRVIWGFGHPFVTAATNWSASLVQEFPAELVKDVQVTTIIEENNSDIETNRFETILRTKGVTEHVDDSLDDQDIKFFHKPESISSGFYTPERRVIPLKDKLVSMDSKLTEVTDMIQGTTSEALSVQCIVDNVAIDVLADVDNVIQLPAYSSIKETSEKIPTGAAFKEDEVVYVPVTIVLKNVTNHTVNLFSVMPGSRSTYIRDLKNHRYPIEDFVIGKLVSTPAPGEPATQALAPETPTVPPMVLSTHYYGPVIVWNSYREEGTTDPQPKAFEQRANQIITYRRTNPYDDSLLTAGERKYTPDMYNSTHEDSVRKNPTEDSGLWIWPLTTTEYGMCLNSDAVNSKLVLAPGESAQFILQAEYRLDSVNKTQDTHVLGFNVRNSLYLDALYYQIEFVAKYNQSTTDLLSSAKTSVQGLTKYNVTVR